jgi:hypothetical protein
MDFTQRSAQHTVTESKRVVKKGWVRLMQLTHVVLLFSSTILIVALVLFLFFGKNNKSEAKFVDTTKSQAVFMNGGQVYFGKVTTLNDRYMVLQDIYYLQVNQQVQPDAKPSANDISLVKLGCELHGPEDRMVIQQDQVIFWENLKEDGKVAQAVKQFKTANPNGLKCENNASTTNSSGNKAN